MRFAKRFYLFFQTAALFFGTMLATAVYADPGKLWDWKDTASLEHSDRRSRFLKLSRRTFMAPPEFYDYIISGKDLPQFGVDLPVLRVVFRDRVFFDTDKSDLKPEALSVIALVAENLRNDVPDVACSATIWMRTRIASSELFPKN